jgi:thiol:disulfide interchange protein
MNKKNFNVLILLLFLSISNLLYSQTEQHFTAKAEPSKIKVSKGEKFEIKLTLDFEKDWYTYSMKEQLNDEFIGPMATEITLAPEDAVKIQGTIKASKSYTKYDKAFEMDLETYHGNVHFIIPAVAQKDLDLSSNAVEVVLYLQQCKDVCIPPSEFKVKISNKTFASQEVNEDPKKEEKEPAEEVREETKDEAVALNDSAKTDQIAEESNIEETAQTESGQSEDIAVTSEEENSEEESSGFLEMLLIAMGAGAAALLTPCVFPMVPITVSFFTKRSEQTKGKGLRDALVYALGIMFTFTGLGFLFSILFGASGIQDLTSSPWVALFISLIFLVFAFNLFGAYEIQMPTSWTNKLNQKSMQGGGMTSVLLMSLTFTLASFSCTGPLVGAALVSAASGDWFYPIISMLGFSFMLAAPFFLLALFPTALSSLPKAGGWMNNVKGVLGFVVVAVMFKFLNATLEDWGIGLSREVFLAIWVGIALLLTLYVLGVFRLSHDSPVEGVGSVRLVFAMLFATLTFYLISGFTGKPMGFIESYLPAPEYQAAMMGGSPAQQQESKWFENMDEAIAEAKKTNKNIFIDFTGKHCPNCRLMERTVFPKPEISSNMNQMVKVKLITDLREEPYISNKKFQHENFGTVAIPYYVIVTPDMEVKGKISYTSADEFRQFLEKGLN